MSTPFYRSQYAGHKTLLAVSGEIREIGTNAGVSYSEEHEVNFSNNFKPQLLYYQVFCLWIPNDLSGLKLRDIITSQAFTYDVTMVVQRSQLPFKEPITPETWLESPRGSRLNIQHAHEFGGIITLKLSYPKPNG
jgi:hypothetical protein